MLLSRKLSPSRSSVSQSIQLSTPAEVAEVPAGETAVGGEKTRLGDGREQAVSVRTVGEPSEHCQPAKLPVVIDRTLERNPDDR